MKTKLLIYLLLLIVLKANYCFSQQHPIPEVELITLRGQHLSSNNILTKNEASVLLFWKSYKSEDIDMINNIIEEIENNPRLDGTKIIAICIDELGFTGHIAPVVYSNGWDIEVFIDTNGDFKRAMMVNSTEDIYLIDSNQELLFFIGNDILAIESYFKKDVQLTYQLNH